MAKLSSSHEIIPHERGGVFIRQRTRDTYIDATAMCQAAGKDLFDYKRQKITKAFLRALKTEPGIPGSELIQVVRGGFPELQGTWVHPRVAIHLGQWLSVEFQVWVTGIVDDWRRLQTILRPAPDEWHKRFPDELWQEIYRLHGWRWSGMGKNRYQIVGSIVNDLVWDRIWPGLRQSIELSIPRLSHGEHAVRMHQLLVGAVGVAALETHIAVMLMLMGRQSTWNGFMFAVNQVLPRSGKYLPPPPKKPPSSQGEFDL